MKEKQFTVKEKIGYGIASMGDTAVYNLLIIYGLFFMTDVVKLEPLVAGNIIFAATAWNAISVGLIGYISDHYSFKGGKRLPYMKLSILPMAVSLVMFFSVINGTTVFVAAYYTIMMAILMTAHSNFMVPYEALGADLTMNADERTDLRSYARFFMGMGNLLGVVFLLPVVEKLELSSLSVSRAWQTAILAVAVIGAISQVVTCRTFDEKTDLCKKEVEQEQKQRLWKEYKELLKLRPFRILLSITMLVCVANVFCNSSIAFFMKYNLGITENSKALVLGIMTAAGLVLTPVLSKASKRYDKKTIMTLCYIITGVIFLFLAIVQVQSLFSLCVYILVFTIGTSAYWQLIYAMLYDISEVDEYENNRRREALILSISKIVLKLANACSTQLLAIVLFCFGYDQNRAEQSSEALLGIQWSLTLIPGILFLAAAVCVGIYPISQLKHKEIVNKLKKRRSNL